MNLGLLEIPSALRKVLSFFRERRNNTGVNVTTPVHQIQAIGREVNIGVAITPKGNGAFSLNVPNGLVSGGNARGTNSVDLQTSRGLATQVASGTNSVVSGGESNVASGQFSTVCGGTSNTASGLRATVGGGLSNQATQTNTTVAGGNTNSATVGNATVSGGMNNTASGAASTVSGGGSNTASGDSSVIAGGINHSASGNNSVISGGNSNQATGNNSTIPGGNFATTNGIQGLLTYGFSGAALARNQMSFFGARPITTNATVTRATADAATASAANQLTLRDNSAFLISGYVSARDTTTNDSKYWTFTGAIKRGAAAANTALVGTPSINTIAQDTAASTWAIALSADTTNGAFAVDVTGQAAKTIRWTVVVHSIEVN